MKENIGYFSKEKKKKKESAVMGAEVKLEWQEKWMKIKTIERVNMANSRGT